MTLLPNHYETFVLTQPSLETIKKIRDATTSKTLVPGHPSGARFTGWVKENRFRVSLKISKPNNYIPLVTGRIEPTSTGCLVFVTYKLFPVTKMFLVFWSAFILLAGTIAGYQYRSVPYVAGAILLLGAVHWITWSNFRLQLKFTHQALLDVLV